MHLPGQHDPGSLTGSQTSPVHSDSGLSVTVCGSSMGGEWPVEGAGTLEPEGPAFQAQLCHLPKILANYLTSSKLSLLT